MSLSVVRVLADGLVHLVLSLFGLFKRRLVVIDVCSQKLYLFRRGRLINAYSISTAAKGTGEVLESFQTPRGWFRVSERFGDSMPLNTVFKARVPSGTLDQHRDLADPILARILRLSGLQFVNANTYSRYVYVHGTDDKKMSTNKPLSQGCVNMRCVDVAHLYEQTGQGLWVYVTDDKNTLFLQPCFFDLLGLRDLPA